MRQSTRLIINSVSTFARMAFSIAVGLLVTRLLVQYLGKEDFGLLLALGGAGTTLLFISSALTAGVQRQLALEIGRGDRERLNQVFSTAWVVFWGIGILLWLVGLLLAPVILGVLTIPPHRATAAWWVYQISLLDLLLTVTATPYRGLLVAHQLLTVNAVADGVTSLTRLIAILTVTLVPWDWMVTYAALDLAGDALIRWSITAYCLWRMPESRPRPRQFNRPLLKEITKISVWSLLNQLSLRIRNQGGIILLNVFFGPVINAGYGVSVQVGGYVLQLAQALRQTVMPAIVGAHAKGKRQNVHRLALVTGKYNVLLATLVFVPIWFEAEQLLAVWLGDVPQFSVQFIRLIIVWTLIYAFGYGYQLALFATGNIGWRTRQQIFVFGMCLIVAGLGFYFGLPPWFAPPLPPWFLPATNIAGAIWLTVINVWGIGAEIQLSPKKWFYEALLPTLAVLLPATICASIVHWTMPNVLWRVLAVTATYNLVAAPLIWWVALADWERQQFLKFATSVRAKFRKESDARSRQ